MRNWNKRNTFQVVKGEEKIEVEEKYGDWKYYDNI